MTLTAVVDEVRIVLPNGEETALQGMFGKLGDLLAQLRDDGVLRLKRSTIWLVEVLPQVMLMDVLFSKALLIDDEVRLLLIRELDAITDWDNEDDRDSSETFAIAKLTRREPTACIVFEQYAERLPGPPVLHRVAEYKQLLAFYREAPEIGDFDEFAYFRQAALAFPHLFFKPDIARECRRFSEPYRAIRPELTRALAALGDLLPVLCKANTDLRVVQKEFTVTTGFEISPDSPNTHKNQKAMRERDVIIGGTRLRCEWHVKLKPQIDRIHFHFGDAKVSDNRIIVGILTDHLTT
jgi:hypothetical protein